jgi:hypothetical protein
MLVSVHKSRQVLAGLALGMAAIKPQLAAPFGLILLVEKQWWAVAVTMVYLIVASAITGMRVDASPIMMLRQMQAYLNSAHWNLSNLGLLDPLVSLGASKQVITGISLCLGGMACCWLMFRYRKRSPLTLMAIASVVAQLWSYHRRYDQVGLIFLLLALGEVTIVERRAWPRVAFALVGLSLWLPNRDIDWRGILPFLQQSVWVFGLIVLLRTGSDRPSLVVPHEENAAGT